MRKSEKAKEISTAAENEQIEKTERTLSADEEKKFSENNNEELLKMTEDMKKEIKSLTEEAARARADTTTFEQGWKETGREIAN